MVLSTQLQPQAARGRTDNPLVRDGMQIVPNVTHVVGRNQKLFFYFEVYEPAVADAVPDLRASLAFYRGKVKVLETPVVERAALDAPDRKAALFRLEVPADAFKPGLYTCQVNIIDAAAGQVRVPEVGDAGEVVWPNEVANRSSGVQEFRRNTTAFESEVIAVFCGDRDSNPATALF